MNRKMMGSVAAIALIATTSFALAQGAGGMGSGGAKGGDAPAASGRSSEAPPANTPAARGAAGDSKPMSNSKSAADEKMAPASKTGLSAQDKSGAAPSDKAGQTAQERTSTPGAKAASDTKAGETKAVTESKTGDAKADTAPQSGTTKSSSNPADNRNSTADTKAGSNDQKTTGNAATGATAAPPTEKRTQITSAIRQEKVEEVRNVNFNVSVGVAVPASVRFHPIPTRVVEIYPEWRGYDFIIVNGRYVILRPQTHEIVYIIEG
jgi:hypothetical protein